MEDQMPIYMKWGESIERESTADQTVNVSELTVTKTTDLSPSGDEVGSGPGDEIASGPGDESPVASGPGDETELKTADDDSFATDFLAEDHTDSSDGLLPTESWRVDPSDPSGYLLYQDVVLPAGTSDTGGEVAMETITIVHEGFDLLI
jgi:hypothetical protein